MRITRHRVCFLLTLLMCVCAALISPLVAPAQAPPGPLAEGAQGKQDPPPQNVLPEVRMRVDVRLVLLTALVSGPYGGPHGGPGDGPAQQLAQSDFRVLENEREQPISIFLAQTEPVHVALLMDTSGSTLHFLPLLKQAAQRFADEFGPDHRLALYDVNVETVRVAGFGSSRTDLKKALGKLETIAGKRSPSLKMKGALPIGVASRRGGTVLYDALVNVERDFPGEAQRRVILVFTDTLDSGSATPFNTLEQRMLRGNTTLYAVAPSRNVVPRFSKSDLVEPAPDKNWAVVLNFSAASPETAARIHDAALHFLDELRPEARVWLFRYQKTLEQFRPAGSLGREPLPPATVRQLLASQAPLEIVPAVKTARSLRPDRILILNDLGRSGVREISRILRTSWGTYALLAPDLFPTRESRAQVLHTLVHEENGPRKAEIQAYERFLAGIINRFRHLVGDTGGTMLEVRSEAELEPSYARIAQQIHSRYTLGYYTRATPGRHALRVEVPGLNAMVQCRRVLIVEK